MSLIDRAATVGRVSEQEKFEIMLSRLFILDWGYIQSISTKNGIRYASITTATYSNGSPVTLSGVEVVEIKGLSAPPTINDYCLVIGTRGSLDNLVQGSVAYASPYNQHYLKCIVVSPAGSGTVGVSGGGVGIGSSFSVSTGGQVSINHFDGDGLLLSTVNFNIDGSIVSAFGGVPDLEAPFTTRYNIQSPDGSVTDIIRRPDDLFLLYYKVVNPDGSIEEWTRCFEEDPMLMSEPPEEPFTKMNIMHTVDVEGLETYIYKSEDDIILLKTVFNPYLNTLDVYEHADAEGDEPENWLHEKHTLEDGGITEVWKNEDNIILLKTVFNSSLNTLDLYEHADTEGDEPENWLHEKHTLEDGGITEVWKNADGKILRDFAYNADGSVSDTRNDADENPLLNYAYAADGTIEIALFEDKVSLSVDAEGNLTIDTKGKVEITAEKGFDLTFKEDITISSDANITLDAGGDALIKAAGNATIETTGDTEIKATGNVSIEATGNAEIKATGSAKLEATTTLDLKGTAGTTVSGATVKIGGTVAPTGSGALCGLPVCLFTGAPHVGDTSAGA